MYGHNGLTQEGQRELGPRVQGRLIGLRVRMTRPLWGTVGSWAVLCGALASNRLYWRGQDLLSLALALVLVESGWGSLWELSTGVDWFRLLREGWPPVGSTPRGWLPYTHPSSPAGRLMRGCGRVTGWWRGFFWPAAGQELLSLLAAVAVVCIMTILLPERLYPLQVAAVCIVLVGAIARRWGSLWLAGQALLQAGLAWLVGHMTFAQWSAPSLVLATAYSLVIWGALRATRRLSGAWWLVNAGQLAGSAVLVWSKQPLVAGLMGLLLLAQIALQVALRQEDRPELIVSRSSPWILVSMLVAVVFLP